MINDFITEAFFIQVYISCSRVYENPYYTIVNLESDTFTCRKGGINGTTKIIAGAGDGSYQQQHYSDECFLHYFVFKRFSFRPEVASCFLKIRNPSRNNAPAKAGKTRLISQIAVATAYIP